MHYVSAACLLPLKVDDIHDNHCKQTKKQEKITTQMKTDGKAQYLTTELRKYRYFQTELWRLEWCTYRHTDKMRRTDLHGTIKRLTRIYRKFIGGCYLVQNRCISKPEGQEYCHRFQYRLFLFSVQHLKCCYHSLHDDNIIR